MLKIQNFAKEIENQLNEIATTEGDGFEFVIYPNEGEYQSQIQNTLSTKIVYGVLTMYANSTIPLKNLGIYNLTFGLEILAPVTRGKNSNDDEYGHVNSIFNVLQEFYQSQTGLSGEMVDNGETSDGALSFSYVLAVNTPQTGMELTGPFGRAIPLTMNLTYQLIAEGVLFNNVTLMIDGHSALMTDFSVENVRNMQTDNILNDSLLKNYCNSQYVAISAVLPYRKDELGETIADACFGEGLEKSHKVVYSDGVITKEMNMQIANAKMSGQVGLNMAQQVTLAMSR